VTIDSTLAPAVRARRAIERRIIRQVCKSALAAGYAVSVDCGEGLEIRRSRSLGKIMAAIMATDEDRLLFHKPTDDLAELRHDGAYQVRPFAWAYLVYGNDGWDVVSDYTTNIEDMMRPANELAERLS